MVTGGTRCTLRSGPGATMRQADQGEAVRVAAGVAAAAAAAAGVRQRGSAAACAGSGVAVQLVLQGHGDEGGGTRSGPCMRREREARMRGVRGGGGVGGRDGETREWRRKRADKLARTPFVFFSLRPLPPLPGHVPAHLQRRRGTARWERPPGHRRPPPGAAVPNGFRVRARRGEGGRESGARRACPLPFFNPGPSFSLPRPRPPVPRPPSPPLPFTPGTPPGLPSNC